MKRNSQYKTHLCAFHLGCTGVAAKAMGKITDMTLANNIPGHLAAPGKLSEIQELARAQTMVVMLICVLWFSFLVWKLGEGLGFWGERNKQKRNTYAKRNDVDVGDGEDRSLAFDVVGFNPENHYGC
jgi:hypothetical protein